MASTSGTAVIESGTEVTLVTYNKTGVRQGAIGTCLSSPGSDGKLKVKFPCGLSVTVTVDMVIVVRQASRPRMYR